jgi:hypothetical protein
MVIFGVFTIYAILSYSTNYLTEMYGMSLVAASYMGIVINKIFRAICGPLGGIITTYSRVKSPTRVIQLLSIVGVLALVALLATNSNPHSVAMGIGLILLLGFTCYASRGLYWACPGEARTPGYIMGTTVGICSVIGFLPDVFVYPIVGHWQDTLPRGRLPQHVADGPRRAVHGDPLYLFAVSKNTPRRRRDRTRGIAGRIDCRRVMDENLKENNNVEEIHHWNRWREPEHQSRDVRSAGKCGL